jgi:hypothetical protein
MLGLVAKPARAQETATTDLTAQIDGFESAAHNSFVGVPTDWSSRHVVFSAPEAGSDAEDQVQQDPRYWLQQIRRALPESDDSIAADSDAGSISDAKKNKKTKAKKAKIKKDWSVSLGGAGSTAGAGNFPAKFTFGTTNASCTDYIVYNTSLAGANPVAATGTGTFSTPATSVAGNTVTIDGVTLTATGIGTDTINPEPGVGSTTTIDGVTYTWHSTCVVTDPIPCVVRTTNTTTDATNLAAAINNTCSSATQCIATAANPGATATTSANLVIVTNTTASAISWVATSPNELLAPLGSISAPSTTGTNFALSTNTTTAATNLATAINNNPSTGVTATSTTNVVHVTASVGGTAGNSLGTTETLVAFSWGGTTLAGGANGQPSIVAFNNLYTPGCNAGTPSTAWAYNTGGTVVTSVVLSLDGTQVAFVHTPTSGASSLEILRPVNGEGTVASPATPDTTCTTGSCYSTCKAGAGSCLLSLTFSVGHNDPHSTPFYDYSGTDKLYVGDAPTTEGGNCPGTTANCSYMHQFTGVFSGSPVESTTGGWPAVVASSPLAGPVYSNGLVFVSDNYDGDLNGPRLHSVNTTASPVTVAASEQLGPTTGSQVLPVDAVIVDPAAAREYEFIGSDGADTPSSAVYEFTTTVTTAPTKVTVGTGSTTGVTVFSGTFDNIYFSSATSSNPSGNLYVCGNAGGQPQLYRIPIASNAMGTPVAITTTLATASTTCSPVSEFLNGAVDQAFVSVEASGRPAGCSGGGCVMSFNITTALAAAATPSASLPETGGTSGIVIDNSSSTAGASQVYFSTLGSALAVQAAQSGL